MTSDEVIERLRDLHSPVPDETFGILRCGGCPPSTGIYGPDQPMWACATAALVYSEEERADAYEAMDLFERWRWDHAGRNRSLAPPEPLWMSFPSVTTGPARSPT